MEAAAIDGLRLKNTGRGLDLGCGTGDMLELLAERYPGMALVGLDFSRTCCRSQRNASRALQT